MAEPSASLTIELENGTKERISDPARLAALLGTLDRGDNSFAILARADGVYIQTALTDSGYVIEKRLGNEMSHVEAARRAAQPAAPVARPWWKFWHSAPKADCFPLEDVVQCFAAFMGEGQEPSGLHWRPATFTWMG
jgi:hypothetical protein